MNTSAKPNAWLGAVALASLLLCGFVEAQVFNVHRVTDNQPDYTDFDSFVDSSTKMWQTPEEKAVALGLAFSELQVFDELSVKPWPAEIWLPEVSMSKR